MIGNTMGEGQMFFGASMDADQWKKRKACDPAEPYNMVFGENTGCRPMEETPLQKFLKETALAM